MRDMARTLTGVILAGGRSRRMGRDKAFLPVGSRTLVEVIGERLREVCGERLLLVTNAPADYRHLGIRTVSDALPSGQSLVGIYTGILHARGPVFVCGCDMPFLNPALIRHLRSRLEDADVVMPRHGGDYEPLHAVYTRACLEPIRRCIERQGRSTDFLPEVRPLVVDEDELRRFDPDLRSFTNVNTPEEYAALLRRLESERC
jgi:molybdopterin-guanine dinucleotide biosynthesis protein A